MLTKFLVSILGLMRALMNSSSSSRGIKTLFVFLVVDGVLSKMKYAKSSSLMDSLEKYQSQVYSLHILYLPFCWFSPFLLNPMAFLMGTSRRHSDDAG